MYHADHLVARKSLTDLWNESYVKYNHFKEKLICEQVYFNDVQKLTGFFKKKFFV